MAFSFVLMVGWIEFKHEGIIKAAGGPAIWAIMFFFVPAIMAQPVGRTLTMTLNVVPPDTSQLQTFEVDFDSTSREDVCAFACHSIEHYMEVTLLQVILYAIVSQTGRFLGIHHAGMLVNTGLL